MYDWKAVYSLMSNLTSSTADEKWLCRLIFFFLYYKAILNVFYYKMKKKSWYTICKINHFV